MYVGHMTRPTALGTSHDLILATGTVRYFESGPTDGPVIVFVHGLLVNADLWRGVVPAAASAGLHTFAASTCSKTALNRPRLSP